MRFRCCSLLGLALYGTSPGGCNRDGDCGERSPVRLSTSFLEPCHPNDFIPDRRGILTCCSDDPAATDAGLPAYSELGLGGDSFGTPLFSAQNNDFSAWGQCETRSTETSFTSIVPNTYCPTPCNPTWSRAQIDIVCGPSEVCLQTIEAEPEDCIEIDGVSRPIRGIDVAEPEDWVVDDPGTRQDPRLAGCKAHAGRPDGTIDRVALRACVEQLSAADQRGYCVPMTPAMTEIVLEDPCN